VKRDIENIMNSAYERDRVTIDKGAADRAISIGHNFEAVIADLEKRMRAAAADLEFEEAGRLRDEIKRLKATELAVYEEPTGRQRGVTAKAGKGGASQYGAAANLPPGKAKSIEVGSSSRQDFASSYRTRAAKPSLDAMGPGTDREVPLSGKARPKGGGKPRGRR
jgi:excinuclease ABC subunit B